MIIGFLPVFPHKTSAKTRREYYHKAMSRVLRDIEAVMEKCVSAQIERESVLGCELTRTPTGAGLQPLAHYCTHNRHSQRHVEYRPRGEGAHYRSGRMLYHQ